MTLPQVCVKIGGCCIQKKCVQNEKPKIAECERIENLKYEVASFHGHKKQVEGVLIELMYCFFVLVFLYLISVCFVAILSKVAVLLEGRLCFLSLMVTQMSSHS